MKQEVAQHLGDHDLVLKRVHDLSDYLLEREESAQRRWELDGLCPFTMAAGVGQRPST